MEPCHVEVVHITEESEADYDNLQKKWKKHLPLGKKTGGPLEDLKQIFPETFDGQVGLFEGDVSFTSHQKQNQFNYHPVLYRKASCHS